MKAVYLEQQHLAQMACFCVLLSVSRSERLFFLLKEILIYKRIWKKEWHWTKQRLFADMQWHTCTVTEDFLCNAVLILQFSHFAKLATIWNSDCQLFTINLPVYSFQLSKNIQIFKIHEGCHLQFYMDNNSLGLIYSMCMN